MSDLFCLVFFSPDFDRTQIQTQTQTQKLTNTQIDPHSFRILIRTLRWEWFNFPVACENWSEKEIVHGSCSNHIPSDTALICKRDSTMSLSVPHHCLLLFSSLPSPSCESLSNVDLATTHRAIEDVKGKRADSARLSSCEIESGAFVKQWTVEKVVPQGHCCCLGFIRKCVELRLGKYFTRFHCQWLSPNFCFLARIKIQI